MAGTAILAIDSGTTNSKAVLVSQRGRILASGSSPVTTRYPAPGWAEQDAEQIWSSAAAAVASCLAEAPGTEVKAIGVSNQRESILAWSRATGEPLGPVITWQCQRTAQECAELRQAGQEAEVTAKTGLPLDPMFSAAKAGWLLRNCCGERKARGTCIGTVDTWLVWKLTGHAVYATDASNASRTQLYNLAEGRWDFGLCGIFGVDPLVLPQVSDSSCTFGETVRRDWIPGGIPVAAAVGDSHGALFSHGAFGPGDGKVTLGTGSSVMAATAEFIPPPRGITTTIAWQLRGTPTFALEGNILVSASLFPWLAGCLGLDDVDALFDLAQSVDSPLGVNVVPAHAGLGSPHWNSEARGLIDGLTFSSGPAHVAHAALRSVALQICDVFEIIRDSNPAGIGTLSADGGPSRSSFLMQMMADYLDYPITTRESPAASAMGAAYLAGLQVGYWNDLEEIASLVLNGKTLKPSIDESARAAVRESWRRSVSRALHAT